jgi:hypothetical protein
MYTPRSQLMKTERKIVELLGDPEQRASLDQDCGWQEVNQLAQGLKAWVQETAPILGWEAELKPGLFLVFDGQRYMTGDQHGDYIQLIADDCTKVQELVDDVRAIGRPLAAESQQFNELQVEVVGATR